jgi:hypothetical protein
MTEAGIRGAANVSFWPDNGDWEGTTGTWVVGTAIRSMSDATEYVVEDGGKPPIYWANFAACPSRRLAEYICHLIRVDAKKPG